MGEVVDCLIVSNAKRNSRDFFVYCLNPKVAEPIEGQKSHYILNTVLPAAFNSQPVVSVRERRPEPARNRAVSMPASHSLHHGFLPSAI